MAAGYTNEMANGIIVGSRIVASAAVTLAYYDYTAMDNCNVKYLVAFIEVWRCLPEHSYHTFSLNLH